MFPRPVLTFPFSSRGFPFLSSISACYVLIENLPQRLKQAASLVCDASRVSLIATPVPILQLFFI
jgi:hypothetical protein